jgi:ParB-like chromosome segregation protein Spo0J
MAQKVMKIHPLCRLFSQLAPLTKQERKEMLEDIKANGIKIPILVSKKKDEIYDGYTRWGIAYDLGIQKSVPMEVFTGNPEAIEAEILSRNLFRRHMTDDQKIAVASKILGPQLEAEAKERQSAAGSFKGGSKPNGKKGPVVAELAKKTGVSEHKARQAEKARKAGMLEDVIQKKTTLRKAAKSAGPSKRKPKKEVPFEDMVYKRWTGFLNRFAPPQRRRVIELVIGWGSDKKK